MESFYFVQDFVSVAWVRVFLPSIAAIIIPILNRRTKLEIMTNKPEKSLAVRKEALSVLAIPLGMLFGTGIGLAINNLALGVISGVVAGCVLFWVLRTRMNRK